MQTDLCVAIFVRELGQAKRDIATAAEAGATLVELRVDQFTDRVQVGQLVRESILPCVVTCRPTWEGGLYDGAEGERLAILDAAASAGARFVDLELRTMKSGWNVRGNRIVSSHDFQGRPERLYNILSELNGTGADVNKIVWMARSIRDNCEAFEILRSRQKPTIALCMGEAGLISRVLAKKFGGFLTFAALDSSGGTAAGQVPVADMKRLYRWDAIGAETKVYGVVGSPVLHSMSPAIHNAAFDAVGHDGVYLPMLVEAGYESFKAFMETFLHCEGLHLSGLSVTIPHKENCLRYLQEKGAVVEELARSIGAVNTVVINHGVGGPSLRGFNTDYAAILDSLTATMGIGREELSNYRVAVVGAGGTGRTAVAALAHFGATVVVYNRTHDKAEALAREFDGKAGKVVVARMEKLCDSCCHVFINTTSVGMHPNVDASPLGERTPKFTDETVVFDTIYNPMETKLLRQAKEAGAKTIGGVEMFCRQAVGQFEAWTGRPAPAALMRGVIERRLSR